MTELNSYDAERAGLGAKLRDMGSVAMLNSYDAEQAVLGAMLMDRVAIVLAGQSLRPQDFYYAPHRMLYSAILALFERNVDIDPVTLSDQLERDGTLDEVGGLTAIYEIAGSVPTAFNVERHRDIVSTLAQQRKLIKAMRNSLTSLENAPAESIDELATHIAVIEEEFRRDVPENNDLIDYHDIDEGQKEQRGLLTGYSDLDRHIDVRPGMVVTVYGDSGHKKTTFAMNLIARWAKTQKIAVYNYEQNEREIKKIIREADHFGQIPKGNLWISPNPPTIEVLPMQCKAIRARKGLDGVVVDYLQTMTTSNARLSEDENNFVRVAMRTLRDLARTNDLWVMVVAQMRKAQGDTAEHQLNPSIDRMRGSGEIKMASSLILSTVMPSKLEMDTWDNESTERMLLVRIKKNRDCLTGDPGEERVVKLVHQLDSRLITSWSYEAGLSSGRLPEKGAA